MKAVERSAEPSQKQTVKSPEQKKQVEHAAGRSAEPAEACGTQFERVLGADSSDSEQVGDEVHQTEQWKMPEKNDEEPDEQEHCVQV